MRRKCLPLLVLVVGCRMPAVDVALDVETQVAVVAATPAGSNTPPDAPLLISTPTLESLDLPTLWDLALTNNPALREAAADRAAALGRQIQAGKCPNPRVSYGQENLGTRPDAAGAVRLELTQEIVTAGKRQYDVAIAAAGTDDATLALVGRKFDVLTRLRRAYYEYLGGRNAERVHEETVASLEQAWQVTRRQVAEAKTRPRTDLLRIEALLEEARIRLASSRINVQAAWQQLAAEIGVPGLGAPPGVVTFPGAAPHWNAADVAARVQAVHTELQQAALEIRRADLEVQRARAEAIPNVTVGAGYSHDFAENLQGAILTLDTALPLWDRKQGMLQEAAAHQVRAQARARSTAHRLHRETTAAFARYETARHHVEQLAGSVVPRLQESVDLLLKSYQAGATQTTFADVLSADQALYTARLTLAEEQLALWLAIADLQGLMQLDLQEEGPGPAACAAGPLPRDGPIAITPVEDRQHDQVQRR